MKSRFSFILIVCVIVFGAILLISKKDAGAPTNSDGSAIAVSNHTKGEGKKGVTLTEYGDFQCPACGGYYPVVEQVVEKYKEDITFKFVNFPLRSIHPNAMLAHRAAEAASNQEKFWEMYALLYQNQTTWSDVTDPYNIFKGYAESIGLDIAKWETDVKGQATNDQINADLAEGQKQGVSSTPTFFIDGKKIENPRDLESFNKAIEDAIKAKNQ